MSFLYDFISWKMSYLISISDSKMVYNYIYMAFLVVYRLEIQKLKIKRINKA